MTDKPTPKEIEDLFVEETGFDIDDFPAAIFDFARAVLDKWGQPSGATEDVENLRKALVYAAFALHDTPQYMLAQGIALIDGDTVRVSRDGWTVEASVNPHRQPALATQPAQAAEPVAWWIPKAEQFCIADKSGDRPFAKAWEPLYAAPQPTHAQAGALPLTDEQIKTLMQAHRTAMLMTCKARVQECGEFAAIAQDLDWLCESFGIKGGQHGTE